MNSNTIGIYEAASYIVSAVIFVVIGVVVVWASWSKIFGRHRLILLQEDDPTLTIYTGDTKAMTSEDERTRRTRIRQRWQLRRLKREGKSILLTKTHQRGDKPVYAKKAAWGSDLRESFANAVSEEDARIIRGKTKQDASTPARSR